MALYFKDIEITKLRDLAPQPGLDITDLWFGETNVYTAWQVYEGTLPATLNANGDDMRQYQIYGNTGGVGGRTVNLCLVSQNNSIYYSTLNAYSINNNCVAVTGQALFGFICKVSPNTEYTVSAYADKTGALLRIRTYSDVPTNWTTNFIDQPVNNILMSPNSDASFTTNNLTNYLLVTFYMSEVYAPINIYNIMLIPGSTAPASFVPFGYEVDMVSRTRNLLDESTLVKGFYTVLGDKIIIFPDSSGSTVYRSFRQSFAPGTYTISFGNNVFLARVIVDGVMSENVGENISSYTVTTQTGDIGFSMRRTTSSATLWNNNPTMLNEGSTALPHEPYSNTTTPIYIGSDPLDKDEYADYQSQKVYRMIDGVLTPTDPPVALPALPTAEGTTIIDYVGQSVAPEKVLLKYRKKNF
jgi:hypothetical protein